MIDIGANLADASFDADRDAVLQRAWSAGVTHIVITGSSARSNADAARLADSDARLSATAGLHPHHAADWSAELDTAIRASAADGALVAVGECGLDYFRDLSPRAAQREAFAAQLAIAADTGLPVFLHQRAAHDDFAAILREHRATLGSCVVHCFTEGAESLADYLGLDCHIGVTGWVCDERRGAALQACVTDIPADRLMIETDAPYLLPRTIRPRPKSRRNEPANLPYVAATIAELRGVSVDTLVRQTTDVAQRFFQLT